MSALLLALALAIIGIATPPAHAVGVASASASWVAPLAHFRLTSCFGPRWGTVHEGIDMVPAWQADGWWARAASSGVVVKSGRWAGGYGISVLIDHGTLVNPITGARYRTLTHEAHLAYSVVQEGQRVATAQTVGRVGSTGDSTGPHLHFEVWRGEWNQINPAPWLRARGVRIGC